MIWAAFAERAPELAARGEARFAHTGLSLVGTLRRDGSPRISPVEVYITDGHLYLGMEWRTRKALDLLRDPRITVHSVIADRHGTEGEFKVYGRAHDVRDASRREPFESAVRERLGEPFGEAEYHLFEVDLESASYVIIEGGKRVLQVWKAS